MMWPAVTGVPPAMFPSWWMNLPPSNGGMGMREGGGGGTPGSLLAQGRKIVPGMKGSRMCQFLLTFHVNYNLQHTCPVYVACRMTNA